MWSNSHLQGVWTHLKSYRCGSGGKAVKHLWVQEMQVWSLGQDDPLEKEVATHSSILAWEIARIKEPGRLESGVRKELWLSD